MARRSRSLSSIAVIWGTALLPGGAALAATFPGAPGTSLLNESFGTPAAAPAFGFNADATVSGGLLNLDNGLANETSAVKQFIPVIARQSLIDVTFGWKYSGTVNSKGGLEFRDLYGRLVFAIQGAIKTNGESQLRYSTNGLDSDSSNAKYVVEPTWTSVPLTVGKTYSIRFQANFAAKTISYQVMDGTTTLVQQLNVATSATGLERMVATSGYKASSNAFSIDNLVVKGKGDAPQTVLGGQQLYAFGDSIVYGHLYPASSFPDFVARQEGMTIVKKAVNGATILPSSKTIVNQLSGAPAASPNFVVFDGGTNDAYPATMDKLGTVTTGFPGNYDTSTFAGAFEDLISKIKAKWPGAKLVYVAVAKLGARDPQIQATLRNIELSACSKWGVAVADVYPALDTSGDKNRVKYSFDSLQASGLPGTADTTGSFTSGGVTKPTGTHPNFPAIETFYAPIVSTTLRNDQ